MKTYSLRAENIDGSLLGGLLQKISWCLVVLLLLYIPFQLTIHRYLNLPYQYLWIDECLIIAAFVLFVFAFSYYGKAKKGAIAILFCLILLVVTGIISAIFNGISFIISFGGILNLIKNFLPIPIFCFLVVDNKRFRSLYKLLHRLALILCLVAIAQEIAFFAGYPMEKLGVDFVDNRFGFMRTPSFMYHANLFGLYLILFFLLDFSLYERFRWQNLLLLLGIILSSSRVVWSACFFAVFYLLMRKYQKLAVIFFPTIIIVAVALIPYFQVMMDKEITYEKYYRRYTILKSVEVWKDHPLLGVGSGMFGGWVTPGFTSPIFEQYNFDPKWMENLRQHRTLDCFWFQLLAENGLVGIVSFSVLLIILWDVARNEAMSSQDPYRKKMLSGFSSMPIVIVIYLFANVLNVTPFLLTYSFLFGMVLGMKDNLPEMVEAKC